MGSPAAGQRPDAGPSGSREPVLRVRDVVKEFGGVRALDGVGMRADAGQVTALVGENGAGKSTLIKCVTGLLRPDAGQITVGGHPLGHGGPIDARLAGVEAVYQDLALADNLDVAANIFLGREERHGWTGAFALRKRHMRARSAEMLDALGVQVPSVSTEVRRLSGGQRQAVSIVRATGWGTRLIVMDEPTAALGVRETERVLTLVRDLAHRDLAVLLISHNLEQVLAVADHVWVLRRGQMVASVRTVETSHAELVGYVTGLTPTPGDGPDLREEQDVSEAGRLAPGDEAGGARKEPDAG